MNNQPGHRKVFRKLLSNRFVDFSLLIILGKMFLISLRNDDVIVKILYTVKQLKIRFDI